MSVKTSELLIPERISAAPYETEAGFEGAIPDYCPDVARIIRVDCAPQILTCETDGDSVKVAGRALFDLLYESERRSGLKSCRVSGDFGCAIPLPPHGQGTVTADCRAVCDRISCRLADSRRPSIKAALTVFTDAACERAVNAVVPESGDGLYFCKTAVGFDSARVPHERVYTFEERIPLAADEKPIGDDLFGRIELSPPRAAAGDGKAELKTRATLRLIYEDETEDGRLCAAEKSIPVNAALELPGITPLSRVSASAEITEQSVAPELDQYGESRIIKVNFKLKARYSVCEPRAYTVASDMFGSGCEVEYETATVKLPHVAASCEKSFTVEAELPPPTPVFTGILDSAAYCGRVESERGEGGLLLRGSVAVCVTGDTDSGVFSVNRKIPFEQFLQCDFPDGATGFEVNVSPAETVVSIRPDGSLAVKATCSAEITVNADSEATFITAMTARREPEEAESDGVTVFRYPAGGEKLWDVAKEYRADPEKIAAANPKRFDEQGILCGSEPIVII